MSLRNYYNNDENKNLVGKHLSTQDGHGGRSAEHRAEMEKIARMVFAEERQQLLEEIQHQYYLAYQQAIDDFLDALKYDIESVTRIGFEGCRDIFEDKKAQKYISDHILKTVSDRLKSKQFRGR